MLEVSNYMTLRSEIAGVSVARLATGGANDGVAFLTQHLYRRSTHGSCAACDDNGFHFWFYVLRLTFYVLRLTFYV